MTEPSPLTRPEPREYADFYADYVGKVPEDVPVLEVMAAQGAELQKLLAGAPAETWDHRYAEGKWSVRELVGHIVDAERIFSYRALRFGRGDDTALPGMDQDVFVAGGDFARRSPMSLLDEARHLRAANLALFESFDATRARQGGEASGSFMTVRALVHVIAGHERHHLDVLRERYL